MFEINALHPIGPVRALNGVNLGPVDRRYSRDYTGDFARLKIPSIRTHDVGGGLPDTVDLHFIFPDRDADPDDPANYHFTGTDDYLQKIIACGAQVYFRLGETIEGRGFPRKTYAHGQRWKPETLARVCLNIMRHYQEGWADGFEWNIPHWQFWNEPGNGWIKPAGERPCWTGTVEEFYTRYRHVATAVKAYRKDWHIGLAGFGRPDFVFPPGHPLFRDDNPWRHPGDLLNAGPFDSISWHQYGASWEDLASSTRMVRDFLDQHGLHAVENHLTEWNYMPYLEDDRGRYCWFDARTGSDPDRLERIHDVMTGVEGAAYVFGGLARLQGEALDLAHLYTGVHTGALGLYDQHGRQHPKFTGMEVFASFLGQERLETTGGEPDRASALATSHAEGLRIGVAHLHLEHKEISVVIRGCPSADCLQATQYLGNGWQSIPVSREALGDAVRLSFPIGGSGLTVLEVKRS